MVISGTVSLQKLYNALYLNKISTALSNLLPFNPNSVESELCLAKVLRNRFKSILAR